MVVWVAVGEGFAVGVWLAGISVGRIAVGVEVKTGVALGEGFEVGVVLWQADKEKQKSKKISVNFKRDSIRFTFKPNRCAAASRLQASRAPGWFRKVF